MLAALFWLTGCIPAGSAGAPPTLKIGLVAPFEGLHRPLGYEALFAVKLALQERNQNGGLNGYRVELVALNDFDDPTEAEAQARALAADPDVLGVVGHLSAGPTLAAAPVYHRAGLAVAVPWTAPALSLPPYAGIVTLAANEAQTRHRLVTTARAAGFKQMATLTGPNFGNISGAIDALELHADGVTAGQTILALRQAGITRPLYGQVDTGSPQLVQVAKAAANGFTYVSPGPAPADVNAAGFANAYQSLAGFPPGPRAILAYDAAQVLLDAIEQAMGHPPRRPDRGQVSAQIAAVRRTGLTGPITFNAQGRRVDPPVWVYQITKETYPGTLLSQNVAN